MDKNWIKRALVASGITRLAGLKHRHGVAILMYHSVMEQPSAEESTLGRIMHTTKVFTGQMEILARHYAPVSMDDVRDFVNGKELPPHAVVVTFDDGYTDNLEVAAPILNRIGIPAIFYITVDCVENGTLPWPSRLRYAFFTTKEPAWKESNQASWPLVESPQRERAYLYACDQCAKLAGDPQEVFVAGVERDLQISAPAYSRKLMMTWDQVRSLAKKGHAIGSHTMTHPNMAYVSRDAAKHELVKSKQQLERMLGAAVPHFSYPCPALTPHWSQQTLEASRDAGYQTAVTTVDGIVHRQDNPLCLRRVRPSKEIEGLRWNLEAAFMGRGV